MLNHFQRNEKKKKFTKIYRNWIVFFLFLFFCGPLARGRERVRPQNRDVIQMNKKDSKNNPGIFPSGISARYIFLGESVHLAQEYLP
eukprot:Pgem_evm1s7431